MTQLTTVLVVVLVTVCWMSASGDKPADSAELKQITTIAPDTQNENIPEETAQPKQTTTVPPVTPTETTQEGMAHWIMEQIRRIWAKFAPDTAIENTPEELPQPAAPGRTNDDDVLNWLIKLADDTNLKIQKSQLLGDKKSFVCGAIGVVAFCVGLHRTNDVPSTAAAVGLLIAAIWGFIFLLENQFGNVGPLLLKMTGTMRTNLLQEARDTFRLFDSHQITNIIHIQPLEKRWELRNLVVRYIMHMLEEKINH